MCPKERHFKGEGEQSTLVLQQTRFVHMKKNGVTDDHTI